MRSPATTGLEVAGRSWPERHSSLGWLSPVGSSAVRPWPASCRVGEVALIEIAASGVQAKTVLASAAGGERRGKGRDIGDSEDDPAQLEVADPADALDIAHRIGGRRQFTIGREVVTCGGAPRC